MMAELKDDFVNFTSSRPADLTCVRKVAYAGIRDERKLDTVQR